MYRQIGKVMIHKLAATAVKQAKPKDKAYKMADGKGMYLLVHPQTGKYWRYDYRFTGKRKTLALGVFPDVSLSDARTLHQQAREKLSSGIDPSEVKRVDKLTKNLAVADSFEAIGREWFNHKVQDKSENHKVRTLRILEKDLFPSIGNRPVAQIKAPEILAALRKIENRGAVDIAHRAKQATSLIFQLYVVKPSWTKLALI
jgi:hypothetical protein